MGAQQKCHASQAQRAWTTSNTRCGSSQELVALQVLPWCPPHHRAVSALLSLFTVIVTGGTSLHDSACLTDCGTLFHTRCARCSAWMTVWPWTSCLSSRYLHWRLAWAWKTPLVSWAGCDTQGPDGNVCYVCYSPQCVPTSVPRFIRGSSFSGGCLHPVWQPLRSPHRSQFYCRGQRSNA